MVNQVIKVKENLIEAGSLNAKKFNMLINNEMFDKLENIVGKKMVSKTISDIVKCGINGLSKITKDEDEWIIYQHLLKKISGTKELTSKEESNNNKDKRKHLHHFTLILISHKEYRCLKDYHSKLNTFSIALLIRVMVEIFFVLYKKYGNKNIALKKMCEGIEKIFDGEVKYQLYFECHYDACYNEYEGFFYFHYYDEKEKIKLSMILHL